MAESEKSSLLEQCATLAEQIRCLVSKAEDEISEVRGPSPAPPPWHLAAPCPPSRP